MLLHGVGEGRGVHYDHDCVTLYVMVMCNSVGEGGHFMSSLGKTIM